MKALVTGAAGMLGTDLCAALEARGHTVVRAGRGADLLPMEVADTAQVRAVLHATRPDVVFHCAAWTNVDGAERDPLPSWRVNALGSWNVAAAAAETGAWVVCVSTDFVFDGAKREPYTEFDPIGPLGAYGASKAAGESLIRAALPQRHIIARTSWLFGPHGSNFVKTIQRLAASRPEVPVVADQIGTPTHTADLARKMIDLAEDPLPGTYHVSSAGQCSWHTFAQAIAARSGLKSEITPITAEEYAARFGSPTRRPAYSVMRNLVLEMRAMDDLPPWEAALDAYLARAELA